MTRRKFLGLHRCMPSMPLQNPLPRDPSILKKSLVDGLMDFLLTPSSIIWAYSRSPWQMVWWTLFSPHLVLLKRLRSLCWIQLIHIEVMPPDVRICAHVSGRQVVVWADATQLGCKLDVRFLLREAFHRPIWRPDHCQAERSYSHRFKSHTSKLPAGSTSQLPFTICILESLLSKDLPKAGYTSPSVQVNYNSCITADEISKFYLSRHQWTGSAGS
jgi:hypothetical protein